MGPSRSYRGLILWPKAMNLVQQVYTLSRQFQREGRYSLVSQIRRAAVSVSADTAEGQARGTTGEFRQFLGIARGSLAESETLIELTRSLTYTSQADVEPVPAACGEIDKLLSGLLKSLKQS